MKRILIVTLGIIALLTSVARAQTLLSQDQSYTYNFLNLQDFGDGYGSPNPRGFATFYTDLAQSSPGSSYRVDLFENNDSESPIATVNGNGNLTANAVNAWQDRTGAARVTVTSGDVYFQALRINVYTPDGLGTYQLYSSDLVAVPEPGTWALLGIGVAGLVAWTPRHRRG